MSAKPSPVEYDLGNGTPPPLIITFFRRQFMRKLSKVPKTKKKTAAASDRATSNKAIENAITKLYNLSVRH
jgi:hypothetical protein